MLAGSARQGPDAGFTLVETLVSLVMLTITLAALIEVFGGGFRSMRATDLDSAALHLARQQLARAGSDLPLSPGQLQGSTSAGLAWSLTIERYQPPRARLGEATPVAASGLEAYWVQSQVGWNASSGASARSISLTTLKLAAP